MVREYIRPGIFASFAPILAACVVGSDFWSKRSRVPDVQPWVIPAMSGLFLF
nr:hypothetical protein [uncultured Alistipes sp.]